MSKIVMLAPVNFLRSYSGFQYMADFLHRQGFVIEVYAHIPMAQMEEAEKLPYRVYSCYAGIFGKIPKIRHLIFRNNIYNALKRCDAVILNTTNPVGYFKECIEFKEKFPQKKFIQYCTELWIPGEQSKYSKKDRDFFLNNANVADVIIDVEPNRALERKKHFHIYKNIQTIPNTLPLNSLEKDKSYFDLKKRCNLDNKKVVLYTGQLSKSNFQEILDIWINVQDEIALVWFAHGSQELIKNARKKILQINKEETIFICDPIPRSELISIMGKAEAGLINYAYSHINNVNLKYAAPTKLYEYISAGLPIISYGNPSIKAIIEKYDLGISSKEDTPSSLGQAVNQLFERKDIELLRKHVKKVFVNELCYEKNAKNALNVIMDTLGDIK